MVGLGNPGIEYQFTPHNAGFLAIDRLAEQGGVAVTNRRCRALTATTRIAGRDVVLAKPETYMNLSGISVQALVKEFEADPARDLIVIYDEIALSLGYLRIRERGSAGGHNGVKSISGALGTEEWLRIRIGVAPPGDEAGESARRGRKDYVLTPFRKAQLVVLDEDLDKLIAGFEGNVTAGGGTVKSTEKLGRRKLAYTVKKFNDGNYVLMTIEANGSLVGEIERRLRVSEPVIKFISVRMDEEEKRVAKIKAIRATRKKLSAQPAAAPAEGVAAPAAATEQASA